MLVNPTDSTYPKSAPAEDGNSTAKHHGKV